MLKLKKFSKILCMALSLLLLASCNTSGGENTSNTEDTTSEVTTPKETEAESETDSETDSDTETDSETETDADVPASVRVMYYNVYGYGNLDTIPDRLGVQVEMIKKADPDIVCAQEFDNRHRETSKKLLEDAGYTEINVYKKNCLYSEGKNCEPIFYRADRLDLVISGGQMLPSTVKINGVNVTGNNGYTKSAAWAIFKDKETGKMFMTVNAHFMYNAPELTVEQAHAVRVENAKLILKLINVAKMKNAAYKDIPVVFGGDLNCKPDSDAYATLKEAMSPAAEVAEKYEKLGYYGHYAKYNEETNEYYNYDQPYESDNIIDHSFVTGMTVKSYLPIKDFDALITSDHLPWVLECEF